jgi:hypothetical protein
MLFRVRDCFRKMFSSTVPPLLRKEARDRDLMEKLFLPEKTLRAPPDSIQVTNLRYVLAFVRLADSPEVIVILAIAEVRPITAYTFAQRAPEHHAPMGKRIPVRELPLDFLMGGWHMHTIYAHTVFINILILTANQRQIRITLHHLQLSSEPPGKRDIICVLTRNELRLQIANRIGQCSRKATILTANDAQATIAPQPQVNRFKCLWRGCAIIEQYEFPVFQLLPNDRLDRFVNEPCWLVENRHQNTYERSCHTPTQHFAGHL